MSAETVEGDIHACKPQACAIQKCLSRNQSDHTKCTDAIDAMKRCCELKGANSIHCAFNGGSKAKA